MTKLGSVPAIRLRGVRQNNLKNFDLDILLGRLTVITGLSGSGKSSLAFDTLFAEGQRRYIETFSPYARQFFDRMDKPQVERIEGIPPAIAIEQRNTVRTTRSTVGTMTELCEYMKLLWPHLARLYCRQCRQPVRRESPRLVWETLSGQPQFRDADAVVAFHLPLSAKLSLAESLELVTRQGYQRLLVGSELIRIEDVAGHAGLSAAPAALTVVQDRVALSTARSTGSGQANRARFIEACEQAYHFGKGKLAVFPAPRGVAAPKLDLSAGRLFSVGFHCAACDLDYREPTPALFSFNHPLGACPTCKGFGRVIRIDYNLAIPDPSRTLAEGCVKPWQTGHGLESQSDLMKFCRAKEIPTDIPFENLPAGIQDWVIEGDKDYGSDEEHEWPRAWYGVKGYFRWLESKAYKMHVRVLLSRYRAYTTCQDCRGERFKPESLLFRIPVEPSDGLGLGHGGTELSLAQFYALPVEQALAFVNALARRRKADATDPIAVALSEARSRLAYLVEVGLGYLTLERPMRTLSGGETERVNLTTCLGTRLCNTLFVLDEPSVGLHPRDTSRLVRILEKLRDTGNTVVVVEHEAAVMKAADRVVDLGPGQGEQGGEVIFNGPVTELLQSERSLTGQYLSGRKQIPIPRRRPVDALTPAEESAGGQASRKRRTDVRQRDRSVRVSDVSEPAVARIKNALVAQEAVMPYGAEARTPAEKPEEVGDEQEQETVPALVLAGATRHNLHDFKATIPLRRFVCLTGVSGSGKTTLVRDILLPALAQHLPTDGGSRKASDRLSEEGQETGDESSGERVRSGGSLAGWEGLAQVVLVDQSPLGKTPRSNPVVYIGAFDEIRDLYAQTEAGRQRGLNSSAFSFNSGVGQCERCRGAGFEKIEMQFLSDIFIRCPDCNGRRYRGHILEVKLERKGGASNPPPARDGTRRAATDVTRLATAPAWSIADMLEATVEEAHEMLRGYISVPAGRRALQRLQLLRDVGLGYLRLGQPINTLSGGESQRLKLVSHLAQSMVPSTALAATRRGSQTKAAPGHDTARTGPTLFLFDEPTTGLHFEDVRILLQVFQRLVDAGHSLLVIEHNLDVIKSADWVIDLGPEAGEGGGKIVAEGTPETVARCPASQTGLFLREVLREVLPQASAQAGFSMKA